MKPKKQKKKQTAKKQKAKKSFSFQDISNWFKNSLLARSPVFQFLGVFLVLIIVFYWLWQGISFDGPFFGSILNTNAHISSFILNIFGYETKVLAGEVSSSTFRVSIKAGCDGIEPTFFFIAATLAFPISIKKKLPGLLIGTLALFFLNIIRVITLFILGVHNKSIFEFFHVGVWQAIFIIAGIVFWLFWVYWATQKQKIIKNENAIS